MPTPISSNSLHLRAEKPDGTATTLTGPLLPARSTGDYFVIAWSIADPALRYCIVVGMTTGPDHGVYDVLLDGLVVRTRLDLYSQRPQRLSWEPPDAVTRSDEHRMTMIVVGRNSRSIGYVARIISITPVPLPE